MSSIKEVYVVSANFALYVNHVYIPDAACWEMFCIRFALFLSCSVSLRSCSDDVCHTHWDAEKCGYPHLGRTVNYTRLLYAGRCLQDAGILPPVTLC